WDKAVSSEPWDLMLTLGFEYPPTDPSGLVADLYAEQGNFNLYGYTPSKDIEAMRQKAKTASSRDAAKNTIQEMFSLVADEQASVFESNYYGYRGFRKKVQGLPESPLKNYWVNGTKETWDLYYYDQ
ncbi:MAG TPA: peptide-binding protein, partial [Halococcus sp.]|nr:peptide-binding protein [Halococcus sp.]